MTRIRTIKPEFFLSESMAQVPFPARLTFIGLWTDCDDAGRGVANPRVLKGALWPVDDEVTHEDVDGHLRVLHDTGHIVLYEVDGKRFYEVVNFTKHQAAAYRRGDPKHPAPPQDAARPRMILHDPAHGQSGQQENSGEETPTAPIARDDVQESAGRTPPRAGSGSGSGSGKPLVDADAPTDEDQPAKKKPPRPPDLVFEATAHVCGIDIDELTDTGRGPLNRAVKELKAAGATPNEVHVRAGRYRKRLPDAALTPTALAKHWASLGTGPSRPAPATRRRCPHDCGQDLGPNHDDGVCRSVRPRKAS